MLVLILTKDQSFKNILIISQSPKKDFEPKPNCKENSNLKTTLTILDLGGAFPLFAYNELNIS
jgi:hypothetical protein